MACFNLRKNVRDQRERRSDCSQNLIRQNITQFEIAFVRPAADVWGKNNIG